VGIYSPVSFSGPDPERFLASLTRKEFPVKRIVSLALASLFVLQSAAAQGGPPLENKDVVVMVANHVPAETIIAKIKSTRCHFDTYPSVLAELRQRGVPEEVLSVMTEFPNGVVSVNSRKQDVQAERSDPNPGGFSPYRYGRGVGREETSVRAAPPPSTEPAARSVAETFTPPAVENGPIVIPEGTAIEIETLNGVSSKDVAEGDSINFVVSRPVSVAGLVVIEKGARAKAVVSKAEGGGSFGRAGELQWSMVDVIAADGSRVPLTFARNTRGEGKGGEVAKKMALTSLYFGPGALFWGFKKGKAAVIPAGKMFDVSVASATEVRGYVVVQSVPQQQTATNVTTAPPDGLPEYGDISEIRRMHKVYVIADDIDSQRRLVGELAGYEGVYAVGSPEEAEFFMAFGQKMEATSFVPRGFFAGTIDKNRKAQFIVYYRAPSGRHRIVHQETEDIQTSSGITFSRANEVNVVRHFIKAMKRERGESR
jgi:hypothetical protein